MHSQAMQLPGEAYGEITDIDHFLYFSITFLQAFAHFVGYQASQGGLFPPEGLADLADDLAPTGGRP
jgi:hypothetical protein